ncbi:MAG: AAA family ATPase [Planctomycetota bacterium]
MRIARVYIENYQSIKKLDFEQGPYCVLIGENNSGKSNILRALSLALGEMWPTERMFSEEDFYNHETLNDIVIQVFIDKVREEWRNNFTMEIAGLELRCKAYKIKMKGKPAGTLTTDYVCINGAGKANSYPAEKLEKGQKYKGQWVPYRVTKVMREQLPFIYVDVLRDYNRQTPGSRWSVLRRLFNEVNTQFLNDKTIFELTRSDGSTAKLTRREAFEESVKDAYKYLRTESFEEIERKLAQNAIEQMGLDAERSKVELHFETHDPTNAFKSLQLYVDQMGIRSPAGEVGAGLQSAIVVAIFRTYEELKKEGTVFAIEEPEVFLYPQKARYFASVLRGLAERGNQVFLTTHSPIFVQLHEPEAVAVVRRDADSGSKVHQAKKVQQAEDDRRALRLLTEFDAQRSELFFARWVMFVEGNTEKVAIPLAFWALGVDVNKENVSVIECEGKTEMPLFARTASAFKIPFVMLVDRDVKEVDEAWSEVRKKEQREKNAKHEKWNRAILDVAGKERVFWLEPDFEGCLGLPREESEKVDQAMELFSTAKEADVPEALQKPMKALLGMLT